MSNCESSSKSKFSWMTTSSQQTQRLGRVLGSYLQPGQHIALFGHLGTGKTTLAGGILAGLGAEAPFRSPTFTLVRQYEGRCPVYHVDLYRLEPDAAVDGLSWDIMLTTDAITLIEWADRLPRRFLRSDLEFLSIKIMRRKTDDSRKIICLGSDGFTGILRRVQKDLEG